MPPVAVSRVPPEISRRDSKTLAGGKRSATTGMRPGRSGDPEGIEESASDVRSSQLCDPFRIKTLPAQQPGGGASLPPAIVSKPLRGANNPKS
jgi:hypothetical protein